MHGFDVWWGTERSAPTARLNCGCFNRSYCMTGHYNEFFACNNYWTVSKGYLQNYTRPETGDDSEFLVDQMEAFVKQAVKNKTPFFVYLPFHTGTVDFCAEQLYSRLSVCLSVCLSVMIIYFLDRTNAHFCNKLKRQQLN